MNSWKYKLYINMVIIKLSKIKHLKLLVYWLAYKDLILACVSHILTESWFSSDSKTVTFIAWYLFYKSKILIFFNCLQNRDHIFNLCWKIICKNFTKKPELLLLPSYCIMLL